MRELNLKEYKSELVLSNKPVIMDFYAEWCGPCKRLSPVMEKLHASYGDKVEIVKVDIEKERELSDTFGIMSVPTVLAMKEGKIVKTMIGLKPIHEYEQIIDRIL